MKRNLFTKIVIRQWNGLLREVVGPLSLEMSKPGHGTRCHVLLAKGVWGHGLDPRIWESKLISLGSVTHRATPKMAAQPARHARHGRGQGNAHAPPLPRVLLARRHSQDGGSALCACPVRAAAPIMAARQ